MGCPTRPDEPVNRKGTKFLQGYRLWGQAEMTRLRMAVEVTAEQHRTVVLDRDRLARNTGTRSSAAMQRGLHG